MDGMTPQHARPERSPQHEREPLQPWQQRIASSVIALVCLILVGYGVAGSYESLFHLALAHNVPLPRLNPVGLDGGLVGVIVLDIVLTWSGHPLALLRFAARLFALGTVAANAAAGWPDPVGVFLRVFAPLLIVIISEAIRTVLLRRAREDRDPIPLARWLLAPWPTFRLWRRMVLWRVHDYGAAVDMEISRLQAIEKLTVLAKGKDWRTAAPGDLAWMLRTGVRMDEALAKVAELCAPPTPVAVPVPTARKRPAAKGRKRAGSAARKGQPAKATATGLSPEAAGMDMDTEALILKYIGEGHSASEAGRLAGVSDSRGRQVARKLAEPAPATGEQPKVS